ncbi:5-formyltetrahydrofolate cyclo-ligase [Klugiella xanthotipulae]|uniref:5-formyltetrahydrofolate cyclo-ligase n=1 Tax=Klugiella xanthotipulae TaxID=244735 RepID=A0A543HYB0_9MICO|nr:5-formyltetrahydrofolate cyclo-ligase [Klugiella xanthotipulae]TQM63344.1 5-formyltetrahydrofolate cyclo-ligase [Klugiella xanthotipulae]
MTNDVDRQKKALRAEIRERRRNVPSITADRYAAGLTDELINLVNHYKARSFSCYLPAGFEPNTRPFLNWAHDKGLRALFPVSREDGLLDWVVGDGESEREGLLGVPEAVGEILSPMAVNDVDLMIIPACAVDATGMRVGWGRGYFDKTIGSMETHPPIYAVIFDTELVDTVPQDLHDQPVSGVVTPTRTITFA